ncbi:MAG TPA: cytochrome c, partial [Verrucomicrobiae bacterium]|nr:cytochrome c [Verrucomicrobiae bacterium]
MRGLAAALAVAAIATRAWALSGAEVYAQACAPCHGADGRGAPAGSGITVPLPDFSDCSVSTAETTANWAGLVRHGGPFLGMSDQMPAFGDALTDEEVHAVLAYLRGFCAEPRYPIGDLNYRRPVFVEKAFPEDELILGGEIEAARRARSYTSELELEARVGPR